MYLDDGGGGRTNNVLKTNTPNNSFPAIGTDLLQIVRPAPERVGVVLAGVESVVHLHITPSHCHDSKGVDQRKCFVIQSDHIDNTPVLPLRQEELVDIIVDYQFRGISVSSIARVQCRCLLVQCSMSIIGKLYEIQKSLLHVVTQNRSPFAHAIVQVDGEVLHAVEVVVVNPGLHLVGMTFID